jgi:transcriptional regulator with XRE-family HTH domain
MDIEAPRESSKERSQLAQGVGRQIMEERLGRGLSRLELGRKLGVPAQQIAKYDKGMDTTPLHRLFALARLFRRTPESFWMDVDAQIAAAAGLQTADRSTLELVRAYQRIGDAKLRRQLLQLMKHLAGEGGPAND